MQRARRLFLVFFCFEIHPEYTDKDYSNQIDISHNTPFLLSICC